MRIKGSCTILLLVSIFILGSIMRAGADETSAKTSTSTATLTKYCDKQTVGSCIEKAKQLKNAGNISEATSIVEALCTPTNGFACFYAGFWDISSGTSSKTKIYLAQACTYGRLGDACAVLGALHFQEFNLDDALNYSSTACSDSLTWINMQRKQESCKARDHIKSLLKSIPDIEASCQKGDVQSCNAMKDPGYQAFSAHLASSGKKEVPQSYVRPATPLIFEKYPPFKRYFDDVNSDVSAAMALKNQFSGTQLPSICVTTPQALPCYRKAIQPSLENQKLKTISGVVLTLATGAMLGMKDKRQISQAGPAGSVNADVQVQQQLIEFMLDMMEYNQTVIISKKSQSMKYSDLLDYISGAPAQELETGTIGKIKEYLMKVSTASCIVGGQCPEQAAKQKVLETRFWKLSDLQPKRPIESSQAEFVLKAHADGVPSDDASQLWRALIESESGAK